MKVFVFLYPDVRYIGELVQNWLVKKKIPPNLDRLNQIIDFRYRQKEYEIFWVMTGQEGNPSLPHIRMISRLIHIGQTDRIVSIGLSYFQFMREIRPNAQILSYLPESITDLKIGGYHQWDCVDKFGKFCWEKDIPTLVDEDTTERYFHQIGMHREIPDTRVFTLEGLGLTPEMMGIPEEFYSEMLKIRQDKPWFVSA